MIHLNPFYKDQAKMCLMLHLHEPASGAGLAPCILICQTWPSFTKTDGWTDKRTCGLIDLLLQLISVGGWPIKRLNEWRCHLLSNMTKTEPLLKLLTAVNAKVKWNFPMKVSFPPISSPHLEDHELTTYCRYWENVPGTPTRLVFLIYPANTFLQQTLLLAWYSPNIHHKGR